MRITHPETELVPYLRGDLSAPDRERVQRHLDACTGCQGAIAAYRRILGDLARTAPLPPQVHWGRYRAELRARLERGARRAWREWLRPAPLALAAGALGVLLMLAGRERLPEPVKRDPPVASEEMMLGRELDLVERSTLVENLDLLEDLDVIQHLEGLSAPREG